MRPFNSIPHLQYGLLSLTEAKHVLRVLYPYIGQGCLLCYLNGSGSVRLELSTFQDGNSVLLLFQVFGQEGDFITAPELTQLFGELLGVWCYYELANTGHKGVLSFLLLGGNKYM